MNIMGKIHQGRSDAGRFKVAYGRGKQMLEGLHLYSLIFVQATGRIRRGSILVLNMRSFLVSSRALIKVITKYCSERIAQFAFEYADVNKRKKVTAVHKANIMKLADGLFLESCREVATKYPEIQYEEIIVDNCCMQLVSKPEQFDVMVTPNLYGNLIANTAAGLAGGTGVMPGGNVGTDHAVFEQGASAGNVGNEKILQLKKANPVALLLSSAMMLRHLEFPSFADRLETAVKRVIAEGKIRTKDLGGDSTTQEVVDAIIAALD